MVVSLLVALAALQRPAAPLMRSSPPIMVARAAIPARCSVPPSPPRLPSEKRRDDAPQIARTIAPSRSRRTFGAVWPLSDGNVWRFDRLFERVPCITRAPFVSAVAGRAPAFYELSLLTAQNIIVLCALHLAFPARRRMSLSTLDAGGCQSARSQRHGACKPQSPT